jgi:hypothetical protein
VVLRRRNAREVLVAVMAEAIGGVVRVKSIMKYGGIANDNIGGS